MKNLINDFLEKCKTPKCILVIGDVLIDEWVQGRLTRISPEAPCPVFQSANAAVVQRPGGAANVAMQLAGWCQQMLVGLSDPITDPGWLFQNCFKSHGIPVKRRFMDGDVQVFRQDVENVSFLTSLVHGLEPEISERISRLIEGADAVVVSDYAKGFITPRIYGRAMNDDRIPVIVDPKFGRGMNWAGCRILKTNYDEAVAEVGAGHFGLYPAGIQNRHGAYNSVVTRGPFPPLVSTHKGITSPCPTGPKVTVRSVVGAGDCFTAFLALATAHSFGVEDAATIAHLAGSVYVQYPHNHMVQDWELRLAADPVGGKVVSSLPFHQFDVDQKVVFTNGVFDLLHPGHLHTLRWARQQGDVLVVGVNTDESAEANGKNPVMPWQARAEVLAGLGFVDWVIPFNEPTPERVLKELKPKVLIKGPDFAGKHESIPGHDLVPVTMTAPPSDWILHSSDLRESVSKS